MKSLAPYQIFFPLGVLNALLAVGVWFVQNLNWFESPVILIHSKLIVGGFIWSFIVGFLMTAVPRMTGSAVANAFEYTLAGILMAGQTVFAWNPDPRFFYANQMLLVSFLLFYGGRRILRMTKSPPVFFSHIMMAMVMALVGSYYHFSGNPFMGIYLYHVGTTLLLVLGIGTRFFSFLTGLASAFENTSQQSNFLYHASGAAVCVLLFLGGQGIVQANLGVAGLMLVYLFKFWKIQRFSDRFSALKIGVRVVAFMIPLSFFMVWLQPAFYVTWLHLLFIGSFAMITFSVATRVVLAHGSYSTDLEMTSPALWYMVGFLMLGIVSRVMYGFSAGLWRVSFLHLAATFWVLAVGSWCFAFVPKIFIAGPLRRPTC
jgi:uncharacterized protein involved in response to NO